MSNHGSDPFEGPDFQRRNELMRKLLTSAAEFRGAIGSYPAGKMSPDDEGAIQFAVGEVDGKVVIDFGTSVHWLAMSPQQAADLASAILSRARLVGRKNVTTFTMTIGG